MTAELPAPKVALAASSASRRAAPNHTAPSEPESDAALLTRCRDGDDSAWDVLVTRYERLLFSVARHNGLDHADAADVCQMAFLALLESVDRVHAEHGIAGWLVTVTRRQAWRLRRVRERERPISELPERFEEPQAGWERVAVLHQALAQLAEPCRELLIALYFDPANPSYAEIAHRFGRSVGGIGPLRGRCLQRMRTMLGEDARA